MIIAQGEPVWKKDQNTTEHVLDYDDRGRVIHDRVTVLATGLDGAVRRISRTYDALDRPVKVSSYDNATVGSGTVVNELQHEYEKFSVLSKIYQEWTGAVNTGTSPKVQLAYQFPTDGTTALRRTSTTYPSGTVVTDEYNTGMDDTLSRLSGRKQGGTWLFQETYLGLGRLVERQYSSTGRVWTLIGTDNDNLDNYLGLDRFGRIDRLVVKNGATVINEYTYAYNYNSQVTGREDLVGNVSGSYEFDEGHTFEGLGRLTDHKRGDSTNNWGTVRLRECWTLNRSGSATSYRNGSTDACTPAISASFNYSNEITTRNEIAYSYDHAGNLTAGASFTFVYDAWNRLIEVVNAPVYVSRYKYNGLSQKIKRTDSSLPDLYYFYNDAWQCVEERKVSDGSVQYWYAYGTQYIDDLAARSVSGGSSNQYLVQDVRFNTVTVLDYAGGVSRRYVYDSYGKPKQLSADWLTWQTITDDGVLFTGRQNHKDPGQTDYRKRWSDPAIGVFVHRDPIGLWGDLGNYGNAYAYVRQDPVNRLDPSGAWMFWDHNDLTRSMLSYVFRAHVPPTLRVDSCFNTLYIWLRQFNNEQDYYGPFYDDHSRHYTRSDPHAEDLLGEVWHMMESDKAYRKRLQYEEKTFKTWANAPCNSLPWCGRVCANALRNLGHLLHSWQDYYAHAVRPWWQAPSSGPGGPYPGFSTLEARLYNGVFGAKTYYCNPDNQCLLDIVPASYPSEHLHPGGAEKYQRHSLYVQWQQQKTDTLGVEMTNFSTTCCDKTAAAYIWREADSLYRSPDGGP